MKLRDALIVILLVVLTIAGLDVLAITYIQAVRTAEMTLPDEAPSEQAPPEPNATT